MIWHFALGVGATVLLDRPNNDPRADCLEIDLSPCHPDAGGISR
jgi:hypothetical protein